MGDLFKQFKIVERLEANYVAQIAYQVALALGGLHERKIIYRNLRPESILIGEKGKLSI